MDPIQHSNSQPRAIIFDLGKVIVDFDHMLFCHRLAPFCQATADGVYAHIFRTGLEKRFDSGELSGPAFFEAARSALAFTVDMDHFTRLWSDIFTLNAGIDGLLRALKENYRLLCLSNTNPWHFNWCLQHFVVLNVFDDFILSYEERCCKPDTAIFAKALAKAQARPQQCIYVDDIVENVSAAKKLHMKAFVFTTITKLAEDVTGAGIIMHTQPT